MRNQWPMNESSNESMHNRVEQSIDKNKNKKCSRKWQSNKLPLDSLRRDQMASDKILANLPIAKELQKKDKNFARNDAINWQGNWIRILEVFTFWISCEYSGNILAELKFCS